MSDQRQRPVNLLHGVTVVAVWVRTIGAAMVVAMSLSVACRTDQDTGLVAHYTFEEGPGKQVKDWSGNGNHGRTVDDVTYITLGQGKGYALSFSTGKAYVDCGDDPSLDLTAALTLELWFNPESLLTKGEMGVVGKIMGSYCMAYSNRCWFYSLDSESFSSTEVLTPGWHHIAATFGGRHTLSVYSESGRQNGLVVHAIPELLYAEIGYTPSPFLPAFGPCTWELLEGIGLLDNLNVILERPPTNEPYAKRWRQQGKKVLTYGNTNSLHSNTADGAYQFWSKLDGLKRPDRDGIMFDELSGDSHLDAYRSLSGGVRKLSDNPLYGDKVLYPYCSRLYASEPGTTFIWETVEAEYELADEKYLQEQPTLVAAQSFLDTSLTQAMLKCREAVPNLREHMIMVLGYMSAPPETLNTDPSLDYKVYLDMQLNLLANDPALKGLYGLMCYHSAYADSWT